MKLLLLAALLIACGSVNKNKKDAVKVAGAWKMLWQNAKTDSLDTTYHSIQQFKIYTDDYMMYARVNPADSSCGFGVGSYTASADTVFEHVIFTADDSVKDETPHDFRLLIELTGKGYKQVIPDIENAGQHLKLTEEYE